MSNSRFPHSSMRTGCSELAAKITCVRCVSQLSMAAAGPNAIRFLEKSMISLLLHSSDHSPDSSMPIPARRAARRRTSAPDASEAASRRRANTRRTRQKYQPQRTTEALVASWPRFPKALRRRNSDVGRRRTAPTPEHVHRRTSRASPFSAPALRPTPRPPRSPVFAVFPATRALSRKAPCRGASSTGRRTSASQVSFEARPKTRLWRDAEMAD